MADLSFAIRKYLIDYENDDGDAIVADLVSDRIYPDAPEEHAQRPLITYSVTSGNGTHSVNAGLSIEQSRVEFECRSIDRQVASNIALAVKSAIMDISAIKAVHSGVWVSDVEYGSMRTQEAPAIDGNNTREFLSSIDFTFTHSVQ